MNKINFGENVRTIRVFKRYTQDYMARKLGFKSQNKYSRIENSPKIPSNKIVNDIATILETPIAELLMPIVRLDTPARQRARIGIYTGITYFVAVGVGIICANPVWEYVDGIYAHLGTTEGLRTPVKYLGGFMPLIICLWSAGKISKRYKAAYGID